MRLARSSRVMADIMESAKRPSTLPGALRQPRCENSRDCGLHRCEALPELEPVLRDALPELEPVLREALPEEPGTLLRDAPDELEPLLRDTLPELELVRPDWPDGPT